MFFISDVFGLIPDSFKQSAVDAIVETVVERGEGLLSDSILNRIKGLRSDAAFRKQLDVGMQRGLQRFADEYQLKDEDLVAAILQDTALFTAHAVRDALIEIVQQPGRYLMEERTLVSQTFAAVLPGRINRERVDRAILYLLKCLAQEMWHLPELQPIYSLEFQRITAEVAHEQLAVQKAQLAALESMNSGVRDAFLQLTEALSEQKRLSVAPETASLSTPRPTIYHNLPRPDYGEFIGREEELNQIFSLLRPSPLSNYHLIVVDGVGGIGKSTLALEVAYRCLQTSLQALEGQKETEQDHLAQMRQILIERFNEEELCDLCFDMALDYEMLPGKGKGSKTRELITYLQRRNRLVELIETVQRLRPDIEYYNWFPNTQDSTVVAEKFDAIIWTSAKQSVLTADGIVARRQVLHTLDEIYTAIAIALQRDDILRTSGHYRDQLVRRALVQQRTLLVIDNFETIDDKSVITFLRELPGTTKAIVTTRYRLDASYPIRLQGMPWRKAKELIKNEAAARNLYLTDKEMRLLFELTGGVPLAIVWSMGQIGYGYIVSSVLKKLSSPNNEIVQYCFENSIEQIKTKPAYQLLLALSLFVTSASRQMLGKITQLSESDRDEGLVQLERLSLVNKSITQDDEDNQSAKLSEPGNQSGSQSRFSLLPLTTNYARARLIDEPTKEKLFHYRWIEDILEFIDLQRKKGYSTLDSVRLEVDNTLAAIDWCWDEDESEKLLQLFYEIDGYLWRFGYWDRLLHYYDLAYDTARKMNSTKDIAKLRIGKANIKDFQDSFDESLRLTEEALAISRTHHYQEEIVLGVFRKSAVLTKLGQIKEASKLVADAIPLSQQLNSRHTVRLYGRLGMIEVASGNYEKANRYFEKARSLFEASEEKDTLSWINSWIYRWLGRIAIENGELDLGADYLHLAILVSREIQSVHDEAESARHLVFLHLARGDRTDAIMVATQARTLFEKLGMTSRVKELNEIISANSQP